MFGSSRCMKVCLQNLDVLVYYLDSRSKCQFEERRKFYIEHKLKTRMTTQYLDEVREFTREVKIIASDTSGRRQQYPSFRNIKTVMNLLDRAQIFKDAPVFSFKNILREQISLDDEDFDMVWDNIEGLNHMFNKCVHNGVDVLETIPNFKFCDFVESVIDNSTNFLMKLDSLIYTKEPDMLKTGTLIPEETIEERYSYPKEILYHTNPMNLMMKASKMIKPANDPAFNSGDYERRKYLRKMLLNLTNLLKISGTYQ